MEQTINYNLKKPNNSDYYNIQDQNDNMDAVDTALKGLEDGKVAKVAGKGLSTEDYTTAEKSKLAGVEAGAEVNAVDSVAGKTGAVVLAADDIGAGTLPGKVVGNNNADYTKQLRNITLSTADPSGGSNGDVWIKYV